MMVVNITIVKLVTKLQWEEPEEHELKDFDKHLDSTSRRNYFVNRKTGRSTWTDREEEELQ